nr:OsmC family protein [Candidatus Sigynarchaeota archaeon]
MIKKKEPENQGGSVKVGLSWERDLIFKIDFGAVKTSDLLLDETNKEEENMVGPTPSRLLASAVLGCLSSSLLFCMSKRDVMVSDLVAEATATTGRDPDGRFRVQLIDVTLKPQTDDPSAIKRLGECKK